MTSHTVVIEDVEDEREKQLYAFHKTAERFKLRRNKHTQVVKCK